MSIFQIYYFLYYSEISYDKDIQENVKCSQA